MTYPDDAVRIVSVMIFLAAGLISVSIMIYLWIAHVRAARARTPVGTPVQVVPTGKPLRAAMLATGLFVVLGLLALNVGR